MRQDLSPSTIALLQGGHYDAHWQIEVENSSGAMVDLSNRISRISGTLPSPDQPIATLDAEFVRAPNDDPAMSLSPFVGASSYSDILLPGREVRARVALTARGAARPTLGFYEILRGRVSRIGGSLRPNGDGPASIHCFDQSGDLQATKSEAEFSYSSGTSIEAAIQSVLDRNGFSHITLNVPVPTGSVLGPTYEPGVQKTVWEQVWALAQSIGWVVWWRYQADGTPALTLFEPDRERDTSVFTVPVIRQINDLHIDGAEIFNVGWGMYIDANGRRQTAGPAEDPASIAKYGGLRRAFWVVEGEDSPIRSDADMGALLTAAVSDTSEPDAVQSATMPLFVFGEVSVDSYTFGPNDLYDSNQLFAPFAISFEHQVGRDHQTTMQTRGKPSGGSATWKGRGGDGSLILPPDLGLTFDLSVDAATGAVTLTPNTTAAEVQSWRGRFVVASVQVDSWEAVQYDDGDPQEIAGGIDTFGTRIQLDANVGTGEAIYFEAHGYDTASTDAASQQAARRSLRVRAWQSRDTSGPDALPILDRDGENLILYPNRNALSGSVRYEVRTDREPTESEVEAGAVLAEASEQVYTWDPEDGEITVWVGVIPYTEDDGTGTAGPMRVRRHTFTTLAEQPAITWLPVHGSNPDTEAIQIVVTDDSDAVSLFYRTYAEGSTPPAFTRLPEVGFSPDPLIHVVEVDVPNEGAPEVIVEAYGADEDGATSDRVALRVDSGTMPSGSFAIEVDALQRVWVVPNSLDPDSGSWRARVVKAESQTFIAPTYTDTDTATAWEGAGSTWGGRVRTNIILESGEEPYLVGHFYRTTSTSGAAQSSSRKSKAFQAWRGMQDPGALSLKNFRETRLSDSEVRYDWEPGALVHEVWIHEATARKPVTEPPWPEAGATPDHVQPASVTSFVADVPPDGSTTYLQFEPRDNSSPPIAGPVQRAIIDSTPGFLPRIDRVYQSPGLSTDTTDVSVAISDPLGRGGTLRMWTNKGSHNDANPNGSPDGTYAVPSTPRVVTAGDTTHLNEVRVHSARGKTIFVEFETVDGASTGQVSHVLHNWLSIIDPEGELVTGAMKTALQFAKTIRPPVVVDSLPAGNPDDLNIVVLTTDGKLYKWENSTWVPVVNAADLDGQILEDQIAAAAVTTERIADAAVQAGKIASRAVTEAKLADLAVTAAKVAESAITTQKIADAAVEAGKLAEGAVGEDHLQSLAVTAAKVAESAITTEKIADAAVDAAKIAPSAVTRTAFANGITPVEIVSSLPSSGNFTGRTVTLTSDGKLYRYTSSGWTAAVPTSDLEGEIPPDLIGPASITASKLAHPSQGMALNNDPSFSDLSAWTLSNTPEPFSVVTVADGPAGPRALEVVNEGTTSAYRFYSGRVSFDVNRTYRLSVWARQTDGDGRNHFLARFRDADGEILNGTGSDASGWVSMGGQHHYWGVAGSILPPEWTRYETSFGPNGTATVPTGARQLEIGALVVREHPSTVQIQDLRIEEVISETLISDDAITAPKIRSEEILGRHIRAEEIVGEHIRGSTITTDHLAFTAVETGNVVAAINASTEGLRIQANRIRIDGNVQFGSGYDPTAVAAASLDKATYLTNGTTTIDGGRITTESVGANQLDANSVVAGKIAAGAVRSDEIQSRAVDTEHLRIGSPALMLNNPSATGTTEGWPNAVLGNVDRHGTAVQAMLIQTDGSVQRYSDWFDVDPTKTYEVRASFRSMEGHPNTNPGGRVYLGLHADDGSDRVDLTGFHVPSRTWGAATNATYFWRGGMGAGEWRDMVGYIIGANVDDPAEVPQGKNVTRHWRMPPETKRIRLHWLNYYNDQSRRLYLWSPTITPVDATQIHGGQIITQSIAADQIAADAITAAKIASGAVTTAKLDALAVTTAKLAAGAVNADKVAANAVTAVKIAAGAVETEKLAAGAVEAGKIASGAVTTAKLDALAVTSAKIAAGAITTDKLDALAVTAGKIAAGTITGDKIAAGTIQAGNIEAGAITTSKIDSGAITSSRIRSGTIQAVNIASGAITAEKLDADAVTAGKIAAGAISSSALFVNGVIESSAIATGAIVASKIAAGQITASKLASLSGAGLTINFDAVGSGAVLSHPGFTLRANGSATFGGTITSGATVSAEDFMGSVVRLHGSGGLVLQSSVYGPIGNVTRSGNTTFRLAAMRGNLLLETTQNSGSGGWPGGDIILNPDGTGRIDIRAPHASGVGPEMGFIEVKINGTLRKIRYFAF